MILSILNLLAQTSSTNAKSVILQGNADNELLQRVYRMAYHPRLQYGIKKIPSYETEFRAEYASLASALEFLEFQLAPRKITGNAAIGALATILSNLTSDDAEVIKRILKRDLDCGASSTLANKVWKNLIPKQPQMLATAMSAKALQEIKFPALAQLKADGARGFAEIRGDSIEDVKIVSRAGNEYTGLDLIKLELINITRAYREVNGPCMVDGELIYVTPKNNPKLKAPSLDWMLDGVAPEDAVADQEENLEVQSVAERAMSNGIANKSLKNTITKAEANNMIFQVWDLVPLDVVYDGEKSLEYASRFGILEELTRRATRVISIESQIVNNIEEARAVYLQYIDKGLEGIILKNTFGRWENKRSKNQVKFKEEITIDMRIVGVIPHSKDPSKLGAIMVKTDDNIIMCKCGSGFTDTDAIQDENDEWIPIPMEQRHELNRSKLALEADDLIDKIVEIKCNGYIQSKTRHDNVSLFLPIIIRFREDKHDTNTFKEVFPDAKVDF